MDQPTRPHASRRGAQANPPNRFESTRTELDFEQLAVDDELLAESREVKTQYLEDHAQSVLSSNDSPDIGFSYSVNPYRGCEHGCAYCYARPTHEFLGLGAGIDFETKIYVKHHAPRLLREALQKPSWRAEPVALSGVTDCYQPAERRFRLTRGCLEVLLELRNPAVIVTKNMLVLRDLDLLKEMARRRLLHVYISITSLEDEMTRQLEPRTSLAAARLETVRRLAAAGVPVGVLVAPVIPGLTDDELPAILARAAEAGATTAGYTFLRLPLAVKPLFLDWLQRCAPLRADRVCSLIEGAREGKLNETKFGTRMRGVGGYADSLALTFKVFAKRYGLDGAMPDYDLGAFRRSPLGAQGEFRF